MLTPDDLQTVEGLIAAKMDILSAFRELPDGMRELLAAEIEGFLYGRQQALRKPKNTYTPRITVAGADINTDSSAVGRGHKGPTLPRWIDFVNATGYLDATDAQIAHIQTPGGGADCMFQVLVSSCFSSLTGWVEGQVFTSLSGCTFKTSLTPQLAMDYIRDNFATVGAVYICKGSYNGGMHVHHDCVVEVIGAGRDMTTIYGQNNAASYVVDAGTVVTGVSYSSFRDLTFDGTQGVAPGNAVFGNQNAMPCSLRNITIKVPASNNGAQFNGNEIINDLRINGPASGTQANSGFTSANNSISHTASNIYISGCACGARFTNAAYWDLSNVYVTGANGGRGDSNGYCGGFSFNSSGGLSNSTFQNITIVDSVVGLGFVNQSGNSNSMQGVTLKNCTTGMDIRGSATGISGWVFNGFNFILGTAGQVGVDFTQASNGHCIACQFTNMNFAGYASGNEIVNASGTHIGTGTCGYHNVSDAGTLADFGSPYGHAPGVGITTEHHTPLGVVDGTIADTATPYVLAGPMAAAGTITGVQAVAAENKTCGATSGIYDVHKVASASVNTDGQGTTIFTTQGNRPTISNGNKKSTTTAPDVTTFAVGDYFCLYTDQVGTSLATVTLSMTVTYP